MKTHLAGVDEVGRGCLFGPVIAAAVILDSNKNFGLKDSKKLTERKRSLLYEDIKQYASKVSIGEASVKEIEI